MAWLVPFGSREADVEVFALTRPAMYPALTALTPRPLLVAKYDVRSCSQCGCDRPPDYRGLVLGEALRCQATTSLADPRRASVRVPVLARRPAHSESPRTRR